MATPAWKTAESLAKAANKAKGKDKEVLQMRLNQFLRNHPEL